MLLRQGGRGPGLPVRRANGVLFMRPVSARTRTVRRRTVRSRAFRVLKRAGLCQGIFFDHMKRVTYPLPGYKSKDIPAIMPDPPCSAPVFCLEAEKRAVLQDALRDVLRAALPQRQQRHILAPSNAQVGVLYAYAFSKAICSTSGAYSLSNAWRRNKVALQSRYNFSKLVCSRPARWLWRRLCFLAYAVLLPCPVLLPFPVFPALVRPGAGRYGAKVLHWPVSAAGADCRQLR